MNGVEFLRQYDDIAMVLLPLQSNVIFGHKVARHFLAQMRKEGRLHHALLFEGERGIGKATLAYHFAWNILNSQEDDFLQPEPRSVVWRQMMQGSHPNLLHVSRSFDFKTQKFKTGVLVDDIRNVLCFLNQTSHDGGWRIVIIDPADDMNRNAANAILKTLEEPPAKTLFIIITHSLGRLFPTIRSRCQRISLRPLCDDEMKQAIAHIFSNQITLDEKDIEIIIQKSKGNPRNAALLIHHGGIEIIKKVDAFFEQSFCDLAVVHTLAQELSHSSSEIQFQQFCDKILDKIQRTAIMFAEKGNLVFSKKCAQTWQETNQKIGEMQLFNLDKKQFIINLLLKLYKIMRNSKLFP
ncbi:DNA polymerase III subunit delta' [Bartonella sp. B41]